MRRNKIHNSEQRSNVKLNKEGANVMPTWRNRVEIKKYLLDDLSDFEVKFVAEALLPQLNRIYKEEKQLCKYNPRKAVNYQLISDLEDVISNLEWIIEEINSKGSIEECSFNTWSEALNSELEVLSRLGDKTVRYEQVFTDNVKFLRVM
jgi:hypothetical protein